MSELKDLLLKQWETEVYIDEVADSHPEIKSVFCLNIKSLISSEYEVGRCRVWVDDDNRIKFIVVEQANGKELRVDSEPPLDTSNWPKRARLHKIQDPWS